MLLFCTFTLATGADYLNARGADLRVAVGVGRVVWYRVLSDDLSDPVVWAIEWVEWGTGTSLRLLSKAFSRRKRAKKRDFGLIWGSQGGVT